jgi:mono/diheme cytochrome c family protein
LNLPFSCRRLNRALTRARTGLPFSATTTYASPISMLLVGALIILAGAGANAQNVKASSQANASPAGDATSGKRIYSSHGCYECHGREGQGSTLSGPRVGPDPIPFPAFVQYLRQPAGQMPPYTTKVISDPELANVYAFLKSLPKPASAQTIRLLNGEEKTSR